MRILIALALGLSTLALGACASTPREDRSQQSMEGGVSDRPTDCTGRRLCRRN